MRQVGLAFAIVFTLVFLVWVILISSLPQTAGVVPPSRPVPMAPEEADTKSPYTLKANVSITRDADGIPTLRAQSEQDAAFALGFVHAQDRLWQMEMMRRLGAGRLAEFLGSSALPLDRFTRTLGLYALAQETEKRLSPPVRALLDAYAAGVNHAQATHTGALPPEFLVLLHRPEPWTAADSLVWGRLMGLWLSSDWTEELVRAALDRKLDDAQRRTLWPALPSPLPSPPLPAPPRIQDLSEGSGIDPGQAKALLAALPAALAPTLASNAWAVAGSRSTTGKPLLAGDPHLGFQAPIQWYLARIETPEGVLAGATAPGVPFLIVGHNGSVAWSFTTTHADTVDLFIEQSVDSTGAPQAQGDHYATPTGPLPFLQRTETLGVRFGEPESLKVRGTCHGPVISDVLVGQAAAARQGGVEKEKAPEGQGQVLALAAPALLPDDVTPEALYHLNRARSAAAVEEAAAFFQSPHQTLVFATQDGVIGRLSPGRVPLRLKGPARRPVPGWSRDHAWVDFVSPALLPRVINPPQGIVFNTNSRIDPLVASVHLADDWPGEDRARRIESLLQAQDKQSPDDMERYQQDVVSGALTRLLPLLLDFPEDLRPPGSALADAHALLAAWTPVMSPERPEPLLASAFLRALVKGIFADEMGDAWPAWERVDPDVVERVLTRDVFWCDNVSTPDIRERCDTVKAKALADALEAARGPDGALQVWGARHVARFENAFWRHFPIVDALTTLEVSTGGDDFTLARGSADPSSFAHHHGAGVRFVVDLANPDQSRFIIATGPSGHPLSFHYRNLLGRWAKGETLILDGKDQSGGVLLLSAP